ncbi:ice-binding family protein [Streptomyces sp. NPDC056672]|uniref:ice-binding family protein n=1 Tax=Streptomyces sp. NPDC056672 TaxID=3345906 RepID=UPI00369580EB
MSGDLGGLTLLPGVYNATSSIGLTGTLTLDAQGDRNAVWVFQIGSPLTTATASNVLLVNGATARNVIWQVGSSATPGTDSDFAGRVLAQISITVNAGVTVNGQVLAIDGSVTLDTNTITRPW